MFKPQGLGPRECMFKLEPPQECVVYGTSSPAQEMNTKDDEEKKI